MLENCTEVVCYLNGNQLALSEKRDGPTRISYEIVGVKIMWFLDLAPYTTYDKLSDALTVMLGPTNENAKQKTISRASGRIQLHFTEDPLVFTGVTIQKFMKLKGGKNIPLP